MDKGREVKRASTTVYTIQDNKLMSFSFNRLVNMYCLVNELVG